MANNGLLLNELGKIFTPFSAILFTPSTSCPIPAFKKDGGTCNFNELVFSSASKFLDAGSSATSLPTIISLAQNRPHDDSLSAPSSGGGNGGGSEGSGQGGNSNGDRKEGDDSHREEGCNEGGRGDDDPSGDDPEGPDKSRESIHDPQVSFDVLSKIYCSDTTNEQGAVQAIFQDLHVAGALKIMVNTFLKAYLSMITNLHLWPKVRSPQARPRDNFGTCQIDFTKLKFGSKRSTKNAAYEQYHVRVTVDTQEQDADVRIIKPLRTPAFDNEVKGISGSKTNWTAAIGGTIGGIFGAIPTVTGTLTATRAGEVSSSSEQKQFTSRITEDGMRGVAWWGFNIDDPFEREGGIRMRDETLPSAKFEFLGNTKVPAPSLPEFVHVEVASYWSILTGDGRDVSWLNTILKSAPKSGLYSNLCQVVVLKIPSQLSERSIYSATLHIDSASMEIDESLPANEPVRVNPFVQFGNKPSGKHFLFAQ